MSKKEGVEKLINEPSPDECEDLEADFLGNPNYLCCIGAILDHIEQQRSGFGTP